MLGYISPRTMRLWCALFAVFVANLIAVSTATALGPREDWFEFDDVELIEIVDTIAFSVDIRASAGTSTTTLEILQPANGPFEVRGRERRGVLSVDIDRPRSLVAIPTGSYRLTLTVPAEVNVRVDAGSGAITVTGTRGFVDLKTTVGDITVMEVTGPKTLRSDIGVVTVEASNGDLTIVTETGSQRVVGVTGTLALRSDTGDILIEQAQGAATVQTNTGTVRGRQVHVEMRGEFTAVSGSIAVDLTDPFDQYRFELESTDGSLHVGREVARQRLAIGSGPVPIIAHTDSGTIRFN